VHPVAFTISGLTVHWYGILLASGFMLGLWTAGRRGMKIGLNAEDLSNLVLWIFICGIAGAKLLYVINEGDTGKPLKELLFQRSGLVFHGALIGASAAIIIFTRVKKMPVWATFDALAPSIALGHAFGRLGCFMTGCCYGKTCALPWAVTFPDGHPTHPGNVHPTQIYESLLNFSLYAGLALLFRKRKFDGHVFAAYLLGYAVIRFGIEFLRDDPRGNTLGGLAPGQLISIGLVIAGGILWAKLRSHPLKEV
jgi:phosphatidylglycerol:prolipoprotein diacylglycerol transferase